MESVGSDVLEPAEDAATPAVQPLITVSVSGWGPQSPVPPPTAQAGLATTTETPLPSHKLLTEIYPEMVSSKFSPGYWTAWRKEASTAVVTAEASQAARAAKKAADAAFATRGVFGITLVEQWRHDHPFARPNPRGVRGGTRQVPFMDSDEPRFAEVPPKFLSEYRMPTPRKVPVFPGGKMSETGRDDMARMLISKEHMKRQLEPNSLAPGDHTQPSGFGSQVLSTKRSAPLISVGAGNRAKMPTTCSPGPMYLPRKSKLVDDHTRTVTFSKGLRPPLMPDSGVPGPQYQVPSTIGTGPAASFGVAGDSRNTWEAKLADPVPEDIAVRKTFSGFGFGCNVDEHIKYGHCLDGRCSSRSNWETVRSLGTTQGSASGHSTPLDSANSSVVLPGDSRSEFIVWRPTSDIFPPYCTQCGARVSVMTTLERIQAVNDRSRGKPVSMVAGETSAVSTPRTIHTSRSLGSMSLSTISVPVSVPSWHGSGRGSGSHRKSRASQSTRNTSIPTIRPPPLHREATTGTLGLTHAPDQVDYILGCGYFCGAECIQQYIVSHVGSQPKSSNIARTAVLQCTLDNQLEELSLLLRNGSQVEIRNDSGRTPLHLAATTGKPLLIDRLLADGNSPLHLAAIGGHVMALERLLAAGADPELLNVAGQTAVDLTKSQDAYHLLKSAVAVHDTQDALRESTLRFESLQRLNASRYVS